MVIYAKMKNNNDNKNL